MKVIILAGGGGTRLFPLSRKCRPKQFLTLADNGESLLAGTVKRFLGCAAPADIIVVTSCDYLHHVKSELAAAGAEAAHVVLEPEPRNTAPAIALAARYAVDVLGAPLDEVLFVSPSDHIIRPVEAFQQAVGKAAAVAFQGYLVTFGIQPTKPETGFGYIETGYEQNGAYQMKAFKEKPDRATAERYLANGHYYWNAGMFAFTADMFFHELQQYAPDIAAVTAGGYKAALEAFPAMPSISLDYALAEKSKRGMVVPLAIYWNDVGSWDAIYEALPKDEAGNALSGDCLPLDCMDSLMLGNSRLIAGIGLKDIMVVETPDVILVAQKGESQKVRELVDTLKALGRREVEVHTTLYYPWGNATQLGGGNGYRMQKLVVEPGGALPLRRHYHRSVHWIISRGTAEVTMDSETRMLLTNESVFIPMTTIYGLKNPGRMPLVVIEVQNGEYLGDDDVIELPQEKDMK